MSYPFKTVERKWQGYWRDNGCFETKIDSAKPKAYVLEMLPYPSGNLHMGHVRNYTLGDAMARFKKALGFEVLHPMGWDSFGLPAENAAMERKTHPGVWTRQNVMEMKKQLIALGFSFDWDREFSTCEPDYYGKEQAIFSDFYEKGLAYRKESWVNWDPVENTVLANEQVVDGKGWRSGATVEKRLLNQWSLKITAYASELLDGLKRLSGWPEKVLKMQENWIGRSEGASVLFKVPALTTTVEIYTTRPETLFGCAFVALSPEHPVVAEIAKNDAALRSFVAEYLKTATTEEAIATVEKQGFYLGVDAIHPFTGKPVPVYAANFVLADYGTGALFGCPAHDARDFEFAVKYGLPIKRVLTSDDELPHLEPSGTLVDSDFLNGLDAAAAKEKAIGRLEETRLGERRVNYRLRDWLISRQRYWGCPIPIIYCDNCGVVPVPKESLPILLPEDVTFDEPGNPLDRHPTWKRANCPKCGNQAVRETDTLDTFFESSWYFMRYCSPNAQSPIDARTVEKLLPVDQYIGGIEHAVLHLLYARFFTKAMRDCGYANIDEPFANLMTQGMVCHSVYNDSEGNWLYPHEVEKSGDGYVKIVDGTAVTVGRQEKMSKSKRNAIDPRSIVESYGADAARLFILSDTPPEKDFDWNDEGLDGSWRYLNRLWRLGENIRDHRLADGAKDSFLKKATHRYARKITDAYEAYAFNKVLAFCRELTRTIEENYKDCSSASAREAFLTLIRVINPITPHLAHELWSLINEEELYLDVLPWPEIDPTLLEDDEITLAVQVNGKLRGNLKIAIDSTDDEIVEKALALSAVLKAVEGKRITKTIVVPKRIVNVVAT